MSKRERCFPLSFQEFLDSNIHRTHLSTMRTVTTATRALSTLTYDAYPGSCSVRDYVTDWKYRLKVHKDYSRLYVPMRSNRTTTPPRTVPVMPQSSDSACSICKNVHRTDILFCIWMIQNICDTLASIFTEKRCLACLTQMFTHLKVPLNALKVL